MAGWLLLRLGGKIPPAQGPDRPSPGPRGGRLERTGRLALEGDAPTRDSAREVPDQSLPTRQPAPPGGTASTCPLPQKAAPSRAGVKIRRRLGDSNTLAGCKSDSSGGGEGSRTPDLCRAKAALYH